MRPFDLDGLRTYDLQSRPSKVFVTDLGRPADPAAPVADWLDTLPKQLAANELRKVRDHLLQAHRRGKMVAVALGGHGIKTGRAAYRAGVPCTVHVALGTDIVHMHPHVSGAALGAASMLDFRILCTVVSKLGGGVWMNLGSAVVMPEVFLKAVSVARNFGCDLDGLVTVNFDKESKYRTGMNVLRRPGSEGIEVIGHHELLIPLWHAAVVAKLAVSSRNDGQQWAA